MFFRPPAAPLPSLAWLAEAGWVFAMHSAQLWADPAHAGARLTDLWLQKQLAFNEGVMKASLAALGGAPPAAVADAAVAPARRIVRANARKIRGA